MTFPRHAPGDDLSMDEHRADEPDGLGTEGDKQWCERTDLEDPGDLGGALPPAGSDTPDDRA